MWLYLTNLCMFSMCVGVVIPTILFCCSRSLFFYIGKFFCCQTFKLAIHKLKIDLSNILIANMQMFNQRQKKITFLTLFIILVGEVGPQKFHYVVEDLLQLLKYLEQQILELCFSFSFEQLGARIKGKQKEGKGRKRQRGGKMKVERNVEGEQARNECRFLGTFQIYSCYITIKLKYHCKG